MRDWTQAGITLAVRAHPYQADLGGVVVERVGDVLLQLSIGAVKSGSERDCVRARPQAIRSRAVNSDLTAKDPASAFSVIIRTGYDRHDPAGEDPVDNPTAGRCDHVSDGCREDI